ncbi:glycosyltransferase family 9 protein [Vogesella fluminis]|uniref:Glycosyl transferase family 9 n=1 Tax=Vogesella fluminis TaxID=1069161 RepID=A0ABQ3H546_9NEIS|nr:glycosyltransferase family 9 protein [Vogesella fluminis]GHD71105.1 glycosyl transferase family 9 [Vogesella fluminis]
MKILVIRRDNIGDLVLTTPLLASLRRAYPAAHIAALVNTYNQAVLAHCPDIDALHVYEKAKHLPGSKLAIWWRTLKLVLALKRQRFDVVILAGNGYSRQAAKFARLVGARKIVGYAPAHGAHVLDHVVTADPARHHHAEVTHRLLGALGIDSAPGAACVLPAPAEAAAARQALAGLSGSGMVIGVHISARKPQQRWPAEAFVALMQALHARLACRFMLFWSPGDEDHPAHPGDDRKAARIVAAAAQYGLPLLPYPTGELPQLIGGLAVCDVLLCSDGGAMHLAAGLGKPMVTFFGNTDAVHWGPWHVPHRLLQPDSRQVADISVAEAESALLSLLQETAPGG